MSPGGGAVKPVQERCLSADGEEEGEGGERA
jgi:hypothetical protein